MESNNATYQHVMIKNEKTECVFIKFVENLSKQINEDFHCYDHHQGIP